MTTDNLRHSDIDQHYLSVQSRGPRFHRANKAFRESKHVHKDAKSTLDKQILQLLTAASELDPDSFDEQVRQLGVLHGHGIGAAHIIANDSGHWTLAGARHTGFELTSIWSVVEKACKAVGQQNAIHLHVLDVTRKLMGIFAPRVRYDGRREMFVLLIPQSKQTEGLHTVKSLVPAIEIGKESLVARDSRWQLETLSQALELLEQTSSVETSRELCRTISRELTQLFSAQLCAIVLCSQASTSPQSIVSEISLASGDEVSSLPQRVQDDILQVALEACSQLSPNESTTFVQEVVHDQLSTTNARHSLIHRQLSQSLGCECVISCPLISGNDHVVGAIVVTGNRNELAQSQTERWLNVAAAPLANGLEMAIKADKSKLRRKLESLQAKLLSWSGVLTTLLLLAFAALMFVPITYRVRGTCLVEPVSRKFASAPFEGFLVEGFVKPGDSVRSGDLLATMEGNHIISEMTELKAKRQQTARRRDIELAERNVSKLFLEELEQKKIEARLAVLNYRYSHLEIRAPIDGIVLSGSLERAEAAAVETGQVLFEIGPSEKMKLEIAIPANEISHVQTNSKTTVWISGQEENAIEGSIVRILPRSQIRNSKSIFVAEIEVDNTAGMLRPGMSGYAKIECQPKSIGWVLFHKPVNSVRAIMGGW